MGDPKNADTIMVDTTETQPTQDAAPAPAAADAIRGPAANAVRKPSTQFRHIHAPPHPSHYAIDAEMVTVVGPGDLDKRRAMVSVGIVNDRLETVLYARVAVPRGCKVTDGAFARVAGGLWASWEEGIPTSCVSTLLAEHASAGGVIVGWEIHGDLEVVGFEKAAGLVRSGDREGLPLDVGAGADDSLPPAAATRAVPPRKPPPSEHETSKSGGGGGGGDQLNPDENIRKQVDAQGAGLGGCPPSPREGRSVKKEERENGSGGGATLEEGGLSPVGEEGRRSGPEKGVQREGSVEESAGLESCDSGAGRREGGVSGEGTRGEISEAGEATMRVVEVTDLFRTTKGLKCTLIEAYAFCFDKKEEAHNAAVDARMTMELYNLWKRTGEPEQPLGLNLSFYVVNFHSFKPSRSRQSTLWSLLRLEGASVGTGRQTVIEKDSDHNTYKLMFRAEKDRNAYITTVENRMAAAGVEWVKMRELVPGKNSSTDGYQLSCRLFKMHVLEHER